MNKLNCRNQGLVSLDENTFAIRFVNNLLKKRRLLFFLLGLSLFCACEQLPNTDDLTQKQISYPKDEAFLITLGVAQDAGYPQAACKKDCCKKVWEDNSQRRMVSCLALIDPLSKEAWIFDATPDFKDQLNIVENQLGVTLKGIFLTHAHIGHYTGLMHLGREAIGAKQIPVFAMPRMQEFLANNGPWSQLVKLQNIQLQSLEADSVVQLNDRLKVSPFLVPHRDEYSETVGFQISSLKHNAIFIPDIDKWTKWERNILELVKQVDYAYLDGTFYKEGEIPGRNMNEIPHPFVEESFQTFKALSKKEKQRIHFIHFNHTNPLLNDESEARREVELAGFKLAEEMQINTL